MSRLVTQLVTDEPAVVLVGTPSVLRDRLADELSGNSISIHQVDLQNLVKQNDLLQSAYKIVWVHDPAFSQESNYLQTIKQLQTYSAPLVVVVPLVSTVESVTSDVLEQWKYDSEQQFQFIVDVNYNLPKASFIFGLNIIGNSSQRNFIPYITANIRKKVLLDPQITISFVSLDDFVQKAAEQVFIPRQQMSVLIKGKDVDRTQFLSLLKKLYDAYHAIHLQINSDIVQENSPTPFSVSQIVIPSDTRTVVTHVVRMLPAPLHESELNKEEQPLPRPSTTQKQAEPIVEKTVSYLQVPQVVDSQPQKIEKQVVNESEVVKEPEMVSEPEVVKEPNAVKTQKAVNESNTEKKTQEEVDINSEIQRIFKTTRKEKKVERVEKIVKSTKKIKSKSKRKTGMFYGGLLSIGFAIGMILLALTYFISGRILKQQVMAVVSHTAETKTFTKELKSSFISNVEFVAAQTDVYGSVLENNLIANNAVLVELAQKFILVPNVLDQAAESTKNLVLHILSGTEGNTLELTENLGLKGQEAYENLSLLQANLEQIDLGDNTGEQEKLLSDLEDGIGEYRKSLAIQQQLQPIIPQMVGVDENRTYALLLQNNQELRPTGGFIQAVALLNFQEGQLISTQVYSVYDLDKQLPGQVIPPDDITKFLGEESWYLRDANWDPDFSKSSTQIAWFIEKALGVSVDGVIGINVFTLEEIMAAVGPIELPEYNEVITDKNIEERMEFHSEVILVDSPDSVDYAVNILQKILLEIQNISPEEIPELLVGLQQSFEDKQLQIASFDESEQSIFDSLGWTGLVTVPSCPARINSGNCVVDVLGQVEANVGVNKANYYINRDISHNISIAQNVAQHTRTIQFENTAQSNAWPKGAYTSYQRYLVDKNAEIESIKINGSELVEQQITVEDVGQLKSVGFRVTVPIKSEVIVELNYSTPLDSQSDDSENSLSYVFFNRKQSGTDADPFSVTITHDPSLEPTLIAPSASITGSVITFDAQTTNEAALFGVKFD